MGKLCGYNMLFVYNGSVFLYLKFKNGFNPKLGIAQISNVKLHYIDQQWNLQRSHKISNTS